MINILIQINESFLFLSLSDFADLLALNLQQCQPALLLLLITDQLGR